MVSSRAEKSAAYNKYVIEKNKKHRRMEIFDAMALLNKIEKKIKSANEKRKMSIQSNIQKVAFATKQKLSRGILAKKAYDKARDKLVAKVSEKMLHAERRKSLLEEQMMDHNSMAERKREEKMYLLSEESQSMSEKLAQDINGKLTSASQKRKSLLDEKQIKLAVELQKKKLQTDKIKKQSEDKIRDLEIDIESKLQAAYTRRQKKFVVTVESVVRKNKMQLHRAESLRNKKEATSKRLLIRKKEKMDDACRRKERILGERRDNIINALSLKKEKREQLDMAKIRDSRIVGVMHQNKLTSAIRRKEKMKEKKALLLEKSNQKREGVLDLYRKSLDLSREFQLYFQAKIDYANKRKESILAEKVNNIATVTKKKRLRSINRIEDKERRAKNLEYLIIQKLEKAEEKRKAMIDEEIERLARYDLTRQQKVSQKRGFNKKYAQKLASEIDRKMDRSSRIKENSTIFTKTEKRSRNSTMHKREVLDNQYCTSRNVFGGTFSNKEKSKLSKMDETLPSSLQINKSKDVSFAHENMMTSTLGSSHTVNSMEENRLRKNQSEASFGSIAKYVAMGLLSFCVGLLICMFLEVVPMIY